MRIGIGEVWRKGMEEDKARERGGKAECIVAVFLHQRLRKSLSGVICGFNDT